MFTHLVPRFSRSTMKFILAALILAILTLGLPQKVSANLIPSFEVVSVRADELVTIRTKDFPANTLFTIRMDRSGDNAVDGIVVGEINTGLGGAFEATFRIPAELRGTQTISIRLESASGYFAYNWFNNRTQGSQGGIPVTGNPSGPVSIPNVGSESGKPYLEVTGVRKNDTITVEAHNLPVNTVFRVRVGPFATFAREQAQVMTVNSGSTGAIRFNVVLPTLVYNVETITVRMDGSGRYAFNAFKNEDRGTVSAPSIPVTGGTPTPVAEVSVTPTSPILKGNEFDAVWTVKNISNRTWDLSAVDYAYVSGTRMYKYNARYDMPVTVKPGETVKIVVDMIAPKDAGVYTTNWALMEGGSVLVNLPLTLRVR